MKFPKGSCTNLLIMFVDGMLRRVLSRIRLLRVFMAENWQEVWCLVCFWEEVLVWLFLSCFPKRSFLCCFQLLFYHSSQFWVHNKGICICVLVMMTFSPYRACTKSKIAELLARDLLLLMIVYRVYTHSMICSAFITSLILLLSGLAQTSA